MKRIHKTCLQETHTPVVCPKDQLLLKQALQFHQQGAFKKAHKTYKRFLNKHPNHAETLGNLGLLLHSHGEITQALKFYRQALEHDPQLIHLFYFQGNGLLTTGRAKEAITSYKKALLGGHNKADTLLQLGTAYTETGHLNQAQDCYEKILHIQPENTHIPYLLGLLFFQQNEFQKAVHCFTDILKSQPEHIDAIFNLALCHKTLGQYTSALQFLKKAEQLSPEDEDILHNIGVLYQLLGDDKKAETALLQALKLNPNHGACLTDLAILYHIQNRLDDTKEAYQRALTSGYSIDSTQHMLSALNGENTNAPPLQYVRNLFNNFADHFDQSLVHDLRYIIPTQLAEIYQHHSQNRKVETAIDLGCGTGLSGLAFRDYIQHLTGIDLAKNMLDIADKKKIYDTLHCLDIINFFKTNTQLYDLAIATDVFVYIGELETFFAAAATTLKPKGILLFSVETCRNSYCLRSSGRYAHSPEYITKLARKSGFTIIHNQPTGIRWERGTWIPGELYMLEKPATENPA